jgi:hypothetical protein
MKRLLILSVLFSLVCFINPAVAQELKLITLDQTDASFGLPSKIILSAGDTLQFKSVNGAFSIYIKDAYKFLRVAEDNLKIRVDSAGDDSSDLYVVRSVDSDIEVTFSIYCISGDSWPDAPPKIIIVSQ